MNDRIEKIVKEFILLFREAREAHERFTQDWKENYAKMGLSYKGTELYESRLQETKIAEKRIFDRILPVVEELKQGDRTHLDVVLAYLAVPDRHFRSGYIKEDLCKALKHIQLSPEEKDLVKNILQDVESTLGSREKKQFQKLIESFAT